MRERDALKREAARQARTDAEVAEEQRQAWRAKYARRGQRAVKAQIDAWLADPNVKDEFKIFLRQCVLPNDAYRVLTPKALEALHQLPYVRPVAENEVVPAE